MATARRGAQQSAERHGVNWDELSPERQTVLTDMSFNMGASGGEGLDGFDNMWANTREAQRTGDQAAWDAAGDEILNSEYAGQVGPTRSGNNAELMRNSDGTIIDERIAGARDAQDFCKKTPTAAWASPLRLLSYIFRPELALAQTFVPVQEQAGPLMDKTEAIKKQTKNIETNTDETRNLSIQICTHLRAIKRIQQRFEIKMAEDADVMRIKSTEIEKYRQAMFGDDGVIKKGGSRLDKDGKEVQDSALYVENTKAYWEAEAREAENIAFLEMAKSSNPNIDVIINNLKNDNSLSLESNLEEKATSPITEVNEIDRKVFASKRIPLVSSLLNMIGKPLAFLTGKNVFALTDPIKSNVETSYEFWDDFEKESEPRNTRFGSYLIAADQLENQKNAAVEAARDEAAQGQGFVGVRTCAIKSDDGKECSVWKTIQPGIIVKEAQTAAINSRLSMYEKADEIGEVGQGNEPSVPEILENKPSSGGGGALGPAMSSPGDIVNNSEELISDASTDDGNSDGSGNSNGDGGAGGDDGLGGTDWSDLSGILDGLFDNDDNANPEDNQAIQAILNLLRGLLDSSRPWIIFKAKDKEGNISLIYWYSPNADSCQTREQWLDGDDTVLKETGSSLGKHGSIRVTIKSGQSQDYKIKCNNARGGRERNLTLKRK